MLRVVALEMDLGFGDGFRELLCLGYGRAYNINFGKYGFGYLFSSNSDARKMERRMDKY